MAAIWVWTRLDLRRRWRSLAVLAVLVAVSVATVITSLAGAHRGSTALDRLRAETLPVDAVVLPNQPGFDWTEIDKLPYVTRVSHFVLGSTPGVEKVGATTMDFLHDDTVWMRDMERPVMREARTLDQTRPVEAVVTSDFSRHFHLGVGDVLVVHLPTPQQARGDTENLAIKDYRGPVVRVHIVGIFRNPWAYQGPGSPGGYDLSPALLATHRDSFIDPESSYLNAMFRLRHGAADIPRLRSDVERIAGRSIDVWNYDESYDKVDRNLRFEGASLAAFGAAAFLAALFLVGQAIGRYAAATTAELESARALGMTPRGVVAAATLAPLLAGAVGSVVGTVAAAFASRWFPIGSAATAEPHPGVDLAWGMLVAGLLVGTALAALAAMLSSLMAQRAAARGTEPRPSSLAAATSRFGLPVPVLVGTRFALERGRGKTAIPVRPALVGAVAGVLGVVAVLVFSHGINDASHHPERFGQTYQLGAFVGFNGHDFVDSNAVTSALRKMDQVSGVDDAATDVAELPRGVGTVQLWRHDGGEKQLPTVVTSGRMPVEADEVALTPGTLESTHLHVGEHVTLNGDQGPRTMRIVGTAFVPTGPHNSYDDGGWVSDTGYAALFKGSKFHLVWIRVAGGHLTPALRKQISDGLLAAVPQAKNLDPLTTPREGELDVSAEMKGLQQVRVLPVALAIFLALLAIGTVGHALGTAVRRRRHDIAVLRALGMTQGQSRMIVVVQATVLGLVGLVFGIPLGIAAGRTLWRLVAGYTPVQYLPPTPLLVLLMIGPVAIVLVNVLAVLPARRAARTRVAAVLRAE
jgi:ABC-type lipoprotein release transport system permease subunit